MTRDDFSREPRREGTYKRRPILSLQRRAPPFYHRLYLGFSEGQESINQQRRGVSKESSPSFESNTNRFAQASRAAFVCISSLAEKVTASVLYFCISEGVPLRWIFFVARIQAL
jgi:hypothetical protein